MIVHQLNDSTHNHLMTVLKRESRVRMLSLDFEILVV